MPRAVYLGTSHGIVHRDLDFAGRSIDLATYRDADRITCAATVAGVTVKGATVDELFGRLVTTLEATEPLHAVARVALRHEVTMALHGDPLPPEPEPITTVTIRAGRPALTTITAGSTLHGWAGRSR